MHKLTFLLLVASFNLPLSASIVYWQDLSRPQLLQQVSYAIELHTLPNFKNSTYALYSLDGLTYVATPLITQAALLGAAAFQNELIKQNMEQTTSLGNLAECQACGCYLGGLGGIAGMGSSGIGGGGYTYSSSSSGFGSSFAFGGGGGGFAEPPSNPPSNPPMTPPTPPKPPTSPPPPEIPLTPEPETWLTLAGALLMALIWKWKKQKKPEKA